MSEQKPSGCQGATIPDDTKVSVQAGDCWQVISGPDQGKLVPMTEEEKALKPAWK